jgi:hypothetical protein
MLPYVFPSSQNSSAWPAEPPSASAFLTQRCRPMPCQCPVPCGVEAGRNLPGPPATCLEQVWHARMRLRLQAFGGDAELQAEAVSQALWSAVASQALAVGSFQDQPRARRVYHGLVAVLCPRCLQAGGTQVLPQGVLSCSGQPLSNSKSNSDEEPTRRTAVFHTRLSGEGVWRSRSRTNLLRRG